MKKFICMLLAGIISAALFAQTAQIAPGARSQFEALLNKPAMIKPATAQALGKNWFRLETDAHVFTDEVSVAQVVSVMLDLEHQEMIFDGKKSKLKAKVISKSPQETIVDFISISMAPLGIQIKTPYRARVTPIINTDTLFSLEAVQLPDDSASNKDIKNMFATRYVEAVEINGKTYVYIRIYTIDEVNASILPRAKSMLENSAGPINEEALMLVIKEAKKR